jgi:hypothetical protein
MAEIKTPTVRSSPDAELGPLLDILVGEVVEQLLTAVHAEADRRMNKPVTQQEVPR